MLCSSVSIVNFEHVIAGWVRCILSIQKIRQVMSSRSRRRKRRTTKMFGSYAVQPNAIMLKHHILLYFISLIVPCENYKKQLPVETKSKEWIAVALSQVRDVRFKRVF